MRREDVPYLAVVLSHVLRHPKVLEIRRQIVPEIEQRLGAPEGKFLAGDFPQVDLIGQLYLVFLLPKETWRLGPNDPVFASLAGKIRPEEFEVEYGSQRLGCETYEFVHRLRNALAHANIELDGDKFQFWDSNGYRVSTNLQNMWMVIQEIGLPLANLVLHRSAAKH